MKQKYFYLFIPLMLLCCTNDKKFDAAIWKKEALFYNFKYRSSMAVDLAKNYSLKGKSYIEIINLLGKPDVVNSYPERELFYTRYTLKVSKDNLDLKTPIVTERLVFEFDKDSLVTSYVIEDSNYLLQDL